MKANHLHHLSKNYIWLCVGLNKWYVVHQKYFDLHEKSNFPVYVNLCIVTLLENGHMKCTSKIPDRWGMPSPMILSITGELSPLMFHIRWHKAYNSEYNSIKFPKIRDALLNMLEINRINEGAVYVKDIFNVDKLKMLDSNVQLTDNQKKMMIHLGKLQTEKHPVTYGSNLNDEHVEINLNDPLEMIETIQLDTQDVTCNTYKESTNKTKRDSYAECTRYLSELEKVTSSFEDFEESVKKINKLMSQEISLHRKKTFNIINGNNAITEGKIVSSNLEHQGIRGKCKRHKSIGEIKRQRTKAPCYSV